MTRRARRNHSAAFKAKVAIAAIKGERTISQIAEQFDVHPNQVTTWKAQLEGGAADVFDGGTGTSPAAPAVDVKALHAKIGALTLESPIPDACTPEELAMVERIANAMVVALENARLFRQTIERQRELEEASRRQELLIQTIVDLSSPVASIAPGILVMPLVGGFDDRRANHFIETLLEAIRERGAQIVLIDIAGVPIVDTSVANYIIQAAQSARLLGAEMVLVGISPAIAQTMVHLGIDLRHITSRADLESGFAYALARRHGRIEYSR